MNINYCHIIRLLLTYFLLLISQSYAAGSSIEISGSNKESLPVQLKIGNFDEINNLNTLHTIISRIEKQLNDSLIFTASLEEDNNNLINKLLNKAPEVIIYDIEISIRNATTPEYLIASVKIHDNFLNKIIEEFEIKNTSDNWYVIAAQISDKIFYAFTGVNGYFDSSIVFISETGRFDERKKKLARMSLYGDIYEEYTNGDDLVLSPTMSDDKSTLAYVSYQSQKPKTYLLNLKTKELNAVNKSKEDIMTLTPNFTRGKSNLLLLSTVYDGNSEVTLYNTQTKQFQRLTNNPATDISADLSLSQNKIVFSSDRSGKPELYLMDSDGSNTKRLKFSMGTYSNPKFSPDGRYIAFTRFLNNKFSIGILDTETFFTKILTTSYKNDSPSWAPNSKYIMFTQAEPRKNSQKKGLSNLFIVDLNGNIINKVSTPFDASEAYWFSN